MNNMYKNLLVRILFAALSISYLASPALAVPSDPNNAALLYYQGFLKLANLEDEARTRLGYVAPGTKAPDDKVREDIIECGEAIEFAEAAVKVPACYWGMRFSKGFETPIPPVAQMRLLTYVLITDARIRAADGDYRAAFERCLMTGKFARHIGDDMFILHIVSIAVSELEYRCMRDIVGRAAGDTELLIWLKNELAASDAEEASLIRPLKYDMEIINDLMQIDNVKKLARVIDDYGSNYADWIIRVADETTLERGRLTCMERMNSALTILSKPTPYDQAYLQLKRLSEDFDSNNPISWLDGKYMPALHTMFSHKTAVETHANAVKAGIEILLARTQAGTLPDSPPAGLPGDLFSGKDFEYEKTKENFVLRCRAKDLNKDKIYQYEFNLNQ